MPDRSFARVAILAGTAAFALSVFALSARLSGTPLLGVTGTHGALWVQISGWMLSLGLVASEVSVRGRALRPLALTIAAGVLAAALAAVFGQATGISIDFDRLAVFRLLLQGKPTYPQSANPLAAAVLAVASASLLLRAWRRYPSAVAVLAYVPILIGLMDCLAFMYGVPLARTLHWNVSPVAGTWSLLYGAGLVAAAGPRAWPLRKLVGPSIQSLLLRWLLPFTMLVVLATDALTINVFPRFSTVMGSILNALVSVAAGVIVAYYLARIIGDRLHRAQEERRAAEEQYRDLVEGVRDVVFSMTPEGILTSLNPAFHELTGLNAEDWIGRPFSALVHPDEMSRAAAEVAAVQRARLGTTPPFRIRSADGGYRLGEVELAARERDGRVISVLGIGRDVTARVDLENELRHAQKMEAVGRLASGVAHDFNNLLTVILGWGSTLLDNGSMDADERAWAEEIVRASRRGSGLTRQLLAFSRRQAAEMQTLDLNDVLLSMDKLLRRLLGAHVVLETKPDASLWAMRADPGALEQVIVNLAVNAQDAMPDGGTLRIVTANVQLDDAEGGNRGDAPAGSYVHMSVSDTGIGMTREVKARMFEPFFTTKEAGKGTGLGLSTVYGIVRQSGGHIAVTSEPGQGTTFDIYFPRVDAAPADVREHTVEGGTARGTETILVAEDEPSVRALLSQALRGYGYQVLVAATGDEALKLAAEHRGPIHLLMTDVLMPGRNGASTAAALLEARPEVRVLYVSGYTDDVVLRHGVLEPGAAFIEKPFTPAELGRVVRELLDGPGPRV